jgi:hypothetical protein
MSQVNAGRFTPSQLAPTPTISLGVQQAPSPNANQAAPQLTPEQLIAQILTGVSGIANSHNCADINTATAQIKQPMEQLAVLVEQLGLLTKKPEAAAPGAATPANQGVAQPTATVAGQPTTALTGQQSAQKIDGPTWLATAKNGPVFADPAAVTQNISLLKYFAQPRANETEVPATLAGFVYGSKPVSDPTVMKGVIDNISVAGAIPTEPEAAKIREAGIANMMNPEWRELVSRAVERNGGLGDSENGFLAFSEKVGFVRLRNPGLTPEQNRKFAEMSLFAGWSIEDLPSRKNDLAFEEPAANKAIEDVIQRFDVKLNNMMADPTKGMTVNDGRRRFVIKYNEEAERFVSYNYKKAGGFKGFMQKAMKFLGPVADIASIALAPTGIGPLIAQGVKMVGGWIANGKVMIGDALKLAASYVPGLSSFTSAIGSFGSKLLSQAGNYLGNKINQAQMQR